MSKFGRYQVAEPPHNLQLLHMHDGSALKPVDHGPKLAVLDQEDLVAQGIYADQFIPGATRVDALGSCTAQANTYAMSNLLTPPAFLGYVQLLGSCYPTLENLYTNTVNAERAGVGFYYRCTHRTADPATEWPPTDCGSSGVFVVQEDQWLHLASGAKIAHGADNIVSLMQTDGIMTGQPWFESWMEPDSLGFIDGNGTASDLQYAINSGVAGGHETYWAAIEQLKFLPDGSVDPLNTVIRFPNSWGSSWGDHGHGRAHLSTFVELAGYCDHRQLG